MWLISSFVFMGTCHGNRASLSQFSSDMCSILVSTRQHFFDRFSDKNILPRIEHTTVISATADLLPDYPVYVFHLWCTIILLPWRFLSHKSSSLPIKYHSPQDFRKEELFSSFPDLHDQCRSLGMKLKPFKNFTNLEAFVRALHSTRVVKKL